MFVSRFKSSVFLIDHRVKQLFKHLQHTHTDRQCCHLAVCCETPSEHNSHLTSAVFDCAFIDVVDLAVITS